VEGRGAGNPLDLGGAVEHAQVVVGEVLSPRNARFSPMVGFIQGKAGYMELTGA